jgi:hypothetical protein
LLHKVVPSLSSFQKVTYKIPCKFFYFFSADMLLCLLLSCVVLCVRGGGVECPGNPNLHPIYDSDPVLVQTVVNGKLYMAGGFFCFFIFLFFSIPIPNISFSIFLTLPSSSFSILYSLFFILYSLFSILYSLFSILYSPFFILHSPFSILHSPSYSLSPPPTTQQENK